MLLVACVYHFNRKKNISQVGKFLKIIQPFSETATEVFHKESHS